MHTAMHKDAHLRVIYNRHRDISHSSLSQEPVTNVTLQQWKTRHGKDASETPEGQGAVHKQAAPWGSSLCKAHSFVCTDQRLE